MSRYTYAKLSMPDFYAIKKEIARLDKLEGIAHRDLADGRIYKIRVTEVSKEERHFDKVVHSKVRLGTMNKAQRERFIELAKVDQWGDFVVYPATQKEEDKLEEKYCPGYYAMVRGRLCIRPEYSGPRPTKAQAKKILEALRKAKPYYFKSNAWVEFPSTLRPHIMNGKSF